MIICPDYCLWAASSSRNPPPHSLSQNFTIALGNIVSITYRRNDTVVFSNDDKVKEECDTAETECPGFGGLETGCRRQSCDESG